MDALAPELSLSLQEFRRFAAEHDGSWELHGGVPVRLQSPNRTHQRIAVRLIRAFGAYFDSRPCEPLPEMDVWARPEPVEQCKSKHTVLKPDLLVYCTEDQYRHGVIHSPQLTVEIWSPSNSLRERTEKQAVYQAIGVKELWLIDAGTREYSILTFESRSLVHISGGSIAEDVLRSQLFPGLMADLTEHPAQL